MSLDLISAKEEKREDHYVINFDEIEVFSLNVENANFIVSGWLSKHFGNRRFSKLWLGTRKRVRIFRKVANLSLTGVNRNRLRITDLSIKTLRFCFSATNRFRPRTN